MLFNSLSFALFFPIVFLAYWVMPDRYRRLWLLLASMYFYMSFVPWYVLILWFVIVVDFILGPVIERSEGRTRRLYLLISLFANLGVLFLFKYFNFFNANFEFLADVIGWNYPIGYLKLILPIGLSFHVFQSLSYVIEVYRGKFKAEKNFLTYALYVMYFPQLVAGPIERPQCLLPQLHAAHTFDAVRARRGLERMLWGFFKKLVIADNIGVIVNAGWANMPGDGNVIIVLAVLFAYQIYCDFSGYSDIAIGAAMMLGVDLTENFNRPYASRSVSEFWRRWHMSLSNWLRDYLYYPLAMSGTRHTALKLHASLFITFVLIGLWHGANWTFVVFGALNGLYVVFGMLTSRVRMKFNESIGIVRLPRVHHAVQVLITFLLFCFCLIFFRAESVGQAWQFISGLGNDIGSLSALPNWLSDFDAVDTVRIITFSAALIVLEAVQYMQAKSGTFYIFDAKGRFLRLGWYYALVISIIFFGYFKALPFIYFQF